MLQATTTTPKLAEMQYRIVRPLGNGAGSSIFQVSDTKKGGYYALKVVKRQSADDDIYVAQALIEAEVASKFNHPNLLKIHDSRVKKAWFKVSAVELLMEFVEGRTLDELEMPERGQMVLVFIHVASALNHMQRRGVFHGDLKPGNIMLSKEGAVKVIDFGTAWVKGEAKNRVQGTPQYMAPEQVRDKLVDGKTDVYNLGATMYRMFTGHHANGAGLPGEDEMLGHRGKLRAPAKLEPTIPVALNNLIMSCLNPNPTARPGPHEVQQELVTIARSMKLKPEDLKGFDEEEE